MLNNYSLIYLAKGFNHSFQDMRELEQEQVREGPES